MRLFEFDNPLESGPETLTSILLTINSQCSNILSIYKETKKVLYRGFKLTDPILIGESPINRKPIDMPLKYQTKIDYLLKQSGFKALRNNSIFCTSNFYTAKYYGLGNPYVIFPLNGFDFTFSKAQDLYQEFEKMKTNYMYDPESGETVEVDDEDYDNDEDDIYYALENNFLGTFEFQKDNLSKALKYENEVYIHGKYIAVKCHGENIDIMNNLLRFSIFPLGLDKI